MNIINFNNKEITLDNVLKYKFELLKKPANFQVDYECLALLNVADDDRVKENSLVVHKELGVFLVEETTKELVNKFYEINGVGFALSKVLANFFSLKHYVPFIFLYVVYMPISGGSRKNTDWIGLHLMNSYRQNDNEAYFVTNQGFIIKVIFPKGKLDDRVHDACVLCEKCVAIFVPWCTAGGMDVRGTVFIGVVTKFKNCDCDVHYAVYKNNEPKVVGRLFINFILDHLGFESADPEEDKKYYRQKLARLRKHY